MKPKPARSVAWAVYGPHGAMILAHPVRSIAIDYTRWEVIAGNATWADMQKAGYRIARVVVMEEPK